MKVLLRNPRREVEFAGPRSVDRLLDELELSREAHLVICNGTLVPGDAVLGDDDQDRGSSRDLRRCRMNRPLR